MSHTPTVRRPPLAGVTWHKPLLILAALMAVTGLVSVVGLVADPREIVGMPAWAKPLKFSISILLYALTLSWLIGQVRSAPRLAWWSGVVAVAALVAEMIIIVGAVLAGTTSHFNVTSPLHQAMWGIMAISIVVVWLASLVIGILLFRVRGADPARSSAIRAGVVIGLVGMALGFLMTSPTAAQLDDWQGISGAHTVGAGDGGAGLFLLGWSTEAGDLRVPHFVGMHALQLLPIAAILLEAATRRVAVLREPLVRRRILRVLAVLYTGILGVLTLQALAGQSVIHPSAGIMLGSTALVLLAALAIAVIMMRGRSLDRSAASFGPAARPVAGGAS
ncbi:hypothetical protein [Arthrobacter agilis]|uniref:hypothetical protein n=1 Tax=Arthrobacter agilis TaxID=37921 RepID=UPI00278A1E8E|nr:hypothetical protein [Arthrobacter agilis]MDQ0736565.1 hypothetical protein [Arthrobacter agilis]